MHSVSIRVGTLSEQGPCQQQADKLDLFELRKGRPGNLNPTAVLPLSGNPTRIMNLLRIDEHLVQVSTIGDTARTRAHASVEGISLLISGHVGMFEAIRPACLLWTYVTMPRRL